MASRKSICASLISAFLQ